MRKKQKQARVILDTNVYISALIKPNSNLGVVLKQCLEPQVRLVISDAQIEELIGVAQRGKIRLKYGLRAETILEFVDAIRSLATVVSDEFITSAGLRVKIRDPKDEIILACALNNNIDFLISGDQDLLVLNGEKYLGKLRIMKPKEFLEH